MRKQSAHINEEHIYRRTDERDQICDDIVIHEDDKEDIMTYDEEKNRYYKERFTQKLFTEDMMKEIKQMMIKKVTNMIKKTE